MQDRLCSFQPELEYQHPQKPVQDETTLIRAREANRVKRSLTKEQRREIKGSLLFKMSLADLKLHLRLSITSALLVSADAVWTRVVAVLAPVVGQRRRCGDV